MKRKSKLLSLLMLMIIAVTSLPGCGESAIQKSISTVTPATSSSTIQTQSDSITPTPTTTPTPTSTPSSTPTPTPEPPQKTGDMAVHFLNVGQGLSILVQSGGQNLIYDGGDRSASSYVVSYLQKQNVETIDYLIASHYDEDHIAGLVGCLNAFDVEMVIGPDDDKDTQIYQSFLNGVSAQGISVQHPTVGQSYDFGTGTFTVLAPASISADDDNANSIVIKLDNGDNSFIFTGDADSESESAMCASGLNLNCDVLSIGHHGSATATSWDFLQNTVPEYAVISCGEGNSYGHPDQDTMDKLQSMGIQVFRTDNQGTIIAVSNGTNITWNQEPCNDYSGGDAGTQPQSQDQPVVPQPQPTEQPSSGGGMVWLSETGSKYHSIPDCGNMNPNKAYQVSRSEAEAQGYEACKKCW